MNGLEIPPASDSSKALAVFKQPNFPPDMAGKPLFENYKDIFPITISEDLAIDIVHTSSQPETGVDTITPRLKRPLTLYGKLVVGFYSAWAAGLTYVGFNALAEKPVASVLAFVGAVTCVGTGVGTTYSDPDLRKNTNTENF